MREDSCSFEKMFEISDECFFCQNFSSRDKSDSCHIYGHPNHGVSYCDDFIGKKRGNVFYKEGVLYRSDHKISSDTSKLSLRFSLRPNSIAFYEVDTKNVNTLEFISLGQKFLLEFQPSYGRNGKLINKVTRIFIPFKKEV